MPILNDIMDRKVPGREFRRGLEQGWEQGRKRLGTARQALRDRLIFDERSIRTRSRFPTSPGSSRNRRTPGLALLLIPRAG
jgi:hypothetical protein